MLGASDGSCVGGTLGASEGTDDGTDEGAGLMLGAELGDRVPQDIDPAFETCGEGQSKHSEAPMILLA